MFYGICIGFAIGLSAGVVWAVRIRDDAHKAIAKTLADFASGSQEARSLVVGLYSKFHAGIKKELDRLL